MLKVIQDFINIPAWDAHPMDPEYITVHTTRNLDIGADAKMHGRFLKNTADVTQKRWHETVDDKVCIQHMPHSINAWASGDGLNGTGNRKSIQVEICENEDGDFDQAVSNAIIRIRQLMNLYNISILNVVPHKRWSGKDCPHLLLKSWDGFIDRLNGAKVAEAPKNEVKPEVVEHGYIGNRVESIYRGSEGLNFYSKPTFNNRYRVGTLKYGYGFPTIVRKLKIEGAYMYEVKNSRGNKYYVTAADKYIKVEGASSKTKPASKPKKSGPKAIGEIKIVNVQSAAIIQDRPNRNESKNIGTIGKGERIQVTGSVKGKNSSSGYWKVLLNGKRAFITGKFGEYKPY
jgi:N-acetylmuramoyl-L-alanine amidase